MRVPLRVAIVGSGAMPRRRAAALARNAGEYA
jgi:hypothetical protein